MSDSNDMKDRLRHLEELYDGGASDPVDGEVAREIASFRKMKALLDARPKQAPDTTIVSAVLAAARGESVPKRLHAADDRQVETASTDENSSPPRRHGDRRPVGRERSTVLRIGTASALVVLLLAVVGILHLEILDPSTLRPDTGTSLSAAERTNPERVDEHQERAEEENRTTAGVGADVRGTESDAAGARSDAAGAGPNGVGARPEAAPPTAARRAATAEGVSIAQSPRSAATAQESDGTPVAENRLEAAPPVREGRGGLDRSREKPESVASKPAFADQSITVLAERAAARQMGAAANRVVPTGQSTADASADQFVSWDERADVLEVYQHIEMIGGGVEQGWEPPSVPLELMPQQESEYQPFLRQAGERQNPNP